MLVIDTATFSRPNKLLIEENHSVISGYVNRTFNRNAKKRRQQMLPKCFVNYDSYENVQRNFHLDLEK